MDNLPRLEKYRSATRANCQTVKLLSDELHSHILSILLWCKIIKIIFITFQKSQPAVIYIVEEHEKARGFDRKHSTYFQDGHRKCGNGMPEFKKDTAFLPSPFLER